MKFAKEVNELKAKLEQYIGVPVNLQITNNRRSMIACKWEGEVLRIRLHHMFMRADAHMVRSLASFCRRPNKTNRAAVNDFISRHDELIETQIAAIRPVKVRTEGEYYNLAEIFAKVNQKHFKRACDSIITWGQPTNQQRRRTIRLGSYDPTTNVIRINPALDAKWVPHYVVETLVYHEMLHWLFRPRRAGDRHVIHSRALRDAEQAHPAFARTQEWIQKNIDRLLKT